MVLESSYASPPFLSLPFVFLVSVSVFVLSALCVGALTYFTGVGSSWDLHPLLDAPVHPYDAVLPAPKDLPRKSLGPQTWINHGE